MGALVQSHEGQDLGKAAFAFLKDHVGDGIVLTGTGKPTHLRENVASFNAAVSAQV
jgi:aryl-alcohol dehydrogenase-like predicted oxidoreductase